MPSAPMIGVAGQSLAASTTYYGAIGNGEVAFQTSEANVQTPFLTAGSVDLMSIRVVSNNRTAASTFAIRKTGVTTASSVSIPATTTGEFQDTTNIVTVAVNDVLNYIISVGSGGSVFIAVMIYSRYTVTGATVTKCIVQELTPVNIDWSNPLKPYSVVVGGSDTELSGVEANTQFQVKAPFTINKSSMWVKIGASTADSNINLIFKINGGNAAAIGIPFGSSFVTISGATSTLNINTNDVIGWYFEGPGATGTTDIIAFGFDLSSSNNQFYLIAGYSNGNTVLSSVTTYTPLAGIATVSASEAALQHKVLVGVTLSFLEIVVITNTVSSSSVLLLRRNLAGGNGAVLIAGSTTGIFIDTTNTQQLTATDTIDGQLGTGAVGTSLAFTYVGMLATVTFADVRTKSRFFQQILHH